MLTATPEQEPRPLGTAVRIDVYSHNIAISRFNREVKDALLDYCRGLAQFGLKRIGPGKFVKSMKCVFVGVTHKRDEFHFHRHEMDKVLAYIGQYGYHGNQLNIVYHDVPEGERVTLRYIETRQPRDYQAPQIDYGCAEGHQKVITARPGRGKTFMAMAIMNYLQTRTVFVIKPMYIKKWIKDLEEAFKFKPGELMVVKGGDQLRSLIALAVNNELKATVILISNATFLRYLKDYEQSPFDLKEIGYGCNPIDFYPTIKAGFRVIDEVHQDYHFNYRQDLYAHVRKALSLSGTLESDDDFITGRYEVQFPAVMRGPRMDDTSHVKVSALFYQFENVDKRIRYTNHAMRSYSHLKFEQSIMKRKELLKSYVAMICDITQRSFVNIRQDGQKMVIYCYTVELCTIVSDMLKKLHPTIDVMRYTSEDPYDEMLESTLIVSTLKSLGTAHDIPGLRTILMTDAVSSRQTNLQAVERLRPLDSKWPGTNPDFLYLVCRDIERHVDYHKHKKDVFAGRVISHGEFNTVYKM